VRKISPAIFACDLLRNTTIQARTANMEASTTTLLTTKRRELLSLDTQKKGLEIEAEAIVSELTATLPEGVSFSLWLDCGTSTC